VNSRQQFIGRIAFKHGYETPERPQLERVSIQVKVCSGAERLQGSDLFAVLHLQIEASKKESPV